MKKRLGAWVLAAALLATPLSALSVPEETEISAASCVLYDPWLGEILYQKDAFSPRPMASTTKIMTAALALELYRWDAPVEVLPQWCGVEGSSMYLKAGEKLTVGDLICGLMLMSGNDAALALSSLLTGDPEDFVALMNDKARALGLGQTGFENASGLDGPGHHASAYDMARLAAWALEQPGFAQVVGQRVAERSGRYMKNHNRLLKTLAGAEGVKTGYTKASGRCLVSACRREGRQLIAVTLNAPDDWRDHTRLYEAAFETVKLRSLTTAGPVGRAYLANGVKPYCGLYTGQGLSAPLSEEELGRLEIKLYGPRMVYGAAEGGAPWGRLCALLDGRIIGETAVFFEETVPMREEKPGGPGGIWKKILQRIRGESF